MLWLRSLYLSSRVAIVVFVFVSQSKLLGKPLFHLVVRHLLTHSLHRNTPRAVVQFNNNKMWNAASLKKLVLECYSQRLFHLEPSTAHTARPAPLRSGCCGTAGWSKPSDPSAAAPPQTEPGHLKTTAENGMGWHTCRWSLIVFQVFTSSGLWLPSVAVRTCRPRGERPASPPSRPSRLSVLSPCRHR